MRGVGWLWYLHSQLGEYLPCGTSGGFFPLIIEVVEVRKKKLVWCSILGELPAPAPEIPPLQGTAHFPSALSTPFKRHLNIGDPWRYCQNKCTLTTPLTAQTPEPPFPHWSSKGKRQNNLSECEIVKLRNKSSQARFEAHLKYDN